MKNEPVVTAQMVTAVISALIVMLVTLGFVELDNTQQAAIMAFSIAVINLVAAVVTRAKVTPLSNPRDRDGVSLVRTETPQ
jgi:hypothetical protein